MAKCSSRYMLLQSRPYHLLKACWVHPECCRDVWQSDVASFSSWKPHRTELSCSPRLNAPPTIRKCISNYPQRCVGRFLGAQKAF